MTLGVSKKAKKLNAVVLTIFPHQSLVQGSKRTVEMWKSQDGEGAKKAARPVYDGALLIIERAQ